MAAMEIVLQEIGRLEAHPNADKLEIAYTKTSDWPVIISKNSFKIGDGVLHFPVDCVIPENIEDFLLGGSKLKLSGGRIRAAKIRGVVSYGILSSFERMAKEFHLKKDEKDFMKTLDCKKSEPTNHSSPKSNIKQTSKKNSNPYFEKYFDMQHLQNCKGVFEDDDMVVVTEKCHGTSARYSYCKRVLKWSKFFNFWLFKRFLNEYEFVYGSRNVQLQDKKEKDNFYKDDVYSQIVKKYKIKEVLKKYPSVSLYGEVVGSGIQKGYEYNKTLEFYAYDIKCDGEYQDFKTLQSFCIQNNIPMVPILDIDKWKYAKEKIKGFFETPSKISEGVKVKEGVVVSTSTEQICRHGRKKCKIINPEFLLNKNNTDWH